MVSRNLDTLEKVKAELGNNCYYLALDVSKTTDFKSIIKKASDMIGENLNALILNAGVSLHEGNFRNVTEEQFDIQMNLNLKANYFFAKDFIIYLEKTI